MDFNKMYQEVLRKETAIFAEADREVNVIKKDYIDELKGDWEAEESDETFAEYFDYYIDEHIDFAFVPYVLSIISYTCDIENADIERLTAAEKHHLTLRAVNHFKEVSGIGRAEEE